VEKTKSYRRTRFSEDVLRGAADILRKQAPLPDKEAEARYLSVEVDGAEWRHDTEEEFFSDYRRSTGAAVFQMRRTAHSVRMQAVLGSAIVSVMAPTRHEVEAVFAAFEQALEQCRVPELPDPPPNEVRPVIFIGHGRSPLWRDLKDHLHEKHGYQVSAYEIGARAGHAIRDVLGDLLAKSSFALLVMTAEDEMADGQKRPRQNVVHEAGLFQGRLGFRRAIVVLESGAEEFSNIHGIEQIRFSPGAIKETFGDVVATIKREFPEGAA
jgi:predicted nucleotide-binding protein